MLTVTEVLAESLFFWSNVVLIVGSVAVLLGTIGAIAMGGAKEQFSNERITANEAETARANESAAAARLETQRLRAKFSWRTLSAVDASKLERILAVHPGSVNIHFTAGDPEAQAFAIQIATVFDKAHWHVAMNGLQFTGAVVFGIWVPDAPNAGDTERVRDAMREIFGGSNTTALPSAGMGFGDIIPNAPVLFVGTKPQG